MNKTHVMKNTHVICLNVNTKGKNVNCQKFNAKMTKRTMDLGIHTVKKGQKDRSHAVKIRS